ncbi:hypothetical protein G7046_g1327 [Stylonectria norvegica]|nr:hypothetical protein G7046_g1327 [Stylonectria norvegica]
MASKQIVLILGSGPRVGASVAEKFASDGYSVVVASRKGTGAKTDEGYLSLKADFSDPESVPAVFDAVKAEFNGSPSSVLSIPAARVLVDLNVNTISPYVAAQEAIKGWATLPKDAKVAFIYTGNILNTWVWPLPMMLDLGMGKSASAYWLGAADALYASKGYRFFYADQRTEEGKSVGQAVDGPAHAEFFKQLANHEGVVPWHATFVAGKGYVQFK